MLAAALVLLANDAFAITATDEEVTLTVPSECSKKEAAKILKDNGLIKSRIWFSLYTSLRGKSVSPEKGSYVIKKSGGFDAICQILSGGNDASREEIRISIPEGSDIDKIASVVCDKYGICDKNEFINEVQNGDFSEFSFVSELEKTKDKRKYRLEGYLYPDTYCFYSRSTAHTVISKMLSNFESKVDGRYIASAKKQGLTLDEAVTLGSIIIREGRYISDMPKISSVLHNRLKSKSFAYRLQSDAVLVYALGREMKSEDKTLDSPYNTYKTSGLPPSPICSPDINAISYAIYPDSTDLFYFVAKADGTVLYARDYKTHLANIEKARKKSD